MVDESNYTIKYHKRTKKHPQYLKSAKLDGIAKALVDLIKQDPYQTPPPVKQLTQNLKGIYSRRINDKHRFCYEVDEDLKQVHILSMWTYYENL